MKPNYIRSCSQRTSADKKPFKKKTLSMIDHKLIASLASIKSEHCISLFIPTHRVDGIQEDQIRYKNALGKIRVDLHQAGLTEQAINKVLKEAEEKLDDQRFWQQLSDTLAVFIYDGKTQFFLLPIRFEEYLFIGDQLYLLPLLPMVNRDDNFYLLALSQNEVKVYEGSRYALSELEKNEAFPKNLQEIQNRYVQEANLQQHTGGSSDTIFHGHGTDKAVEDARLQEFLREVDEGIQKLVCDDDKTPLILYTTPTLLGLYREVNTYPQLLEEYVAGNPEGEKMADLHARAWEKLLPLSLAQEAEEEEQFEEMLANEQAAFNLLTVAPAAFAGRIERLYLAADTEAWGHYDHAQHLVRMHAKRQADSQPLLNDMALAVHQQGGTVILRDQEDLMRPTAYANATFRYAMQLS